MTLLYRLLICILAWAFSAHAGIEDYFKPVVGKRHANQMEKIDFIYMINLDERPEKYTSCIQKLALHNIVPHRFSAVNGWELSMQSLNELGVKYGPWMDSRMGTCYLIEDNGKAMHEELCMPGRNYFSHCMSRGAVGIVLSHLSILQDAFTSGYETIWVMEDDIEVMRDPHVLTELIDELDSTVGKNGWDILFTDLDTKGDDGKRVPCASYAWRPNFTPLDPYRFAEKQLISPHLRRIGSRYGAYSMIVRRSGMQKILNFFLNHQIFLPYDMEYTQPHDIRLYTVLEDVVSTQIHAISDNGGPNYIQSNY